jgi:hypothetical protein
MRFELRDLPGRTDVADNEVTLAEGVPTCYLHGRMEIMGEPADLWRCPTCLGLAFGDFIIEEWPFG